MKKYLMRNLISVTELKSQLDQLQVIDCSWFMPSSGKIAINEYQKKRIGKAKFFDIDQCSDKNTELPHMMPDNKTFVNYLRGQGIEFDVPTVVYDKVGLFSAARGWFMLKSFGFEQVAVLDGGMPAWEKAGFSTEGDNSNLETKSVVGEIKSRNPAKMVLTKEEVVKRVETKKNGNADLIDARSAARFTGKSPEPRAGLKQGHIPGSLNVPFTDLLTAEGCFKSLKEQEEIFKNAGIDLNAKSALFTCGSGVTACIPMLALVENFGFKFEDCKVYDGSFAEWGLRDLDLQVDRLDD